MASPETQTLQFAMKALGVMMMTAFYPLIIALPQQLAPNGEWEAPLSPDDPALKMLWRGFAWMPYQPEFTWMVVGTYGVMGATLVWAGMDSDIKRSRHLLNFVIY